MRPCLLFGAALCLTLCSAAASAETINFNNQASPNLTTFTTDTQGNFTVVNTGGEYQVGQLFGNPVPDLFVDVESGTIAVTRNNGGDFTFSSVDLAAFDDSGTYSIDGSLGGTSVFDASGTIGDTAAFFTFDPGDSADVINSLTITLTDPVYESDLDNIVVAVSKSAVTPEPSSLVLLGTGLLGCIGAARRRLLA